MGRQGANGERRSAADPGSWPLRVQYSAGCQCESEGESEGAREGE